MGMVGLELARFGNALVLLGGDAQPLTAQGLVLSGLGQRYFVRPSVMRSVH